MRTPDPFPWPLAVAATAGGLGLVAAALALLGVVPFMRRAGWQTCEIAVWRSNGDGDFYAQVGRKPDDQVRSPKFRLHGDEPPASAVGIVAAHRALVQQLEWDGWKPDDARNGVWWQRSFHRARADSA